MHSIEFSNVTVYGKDGCKFCDLAKDKFRRMGIPFEFKYLGDFVEYHEGWREDHSIEISAAFDLYDRAVPIISIDGLYFTYPEAMRYAKEKQARVKKVVKMEGTLVFSLAAAAS
jgi:glutaredoxin